MREFVRSQTRAYVRLDETPEQDQDRTDPPYPPADRLTPPRRARQPRPRRGTKLSVAANPLCQLAELNTTVVGAPEQRLADPTRREIGRWDVRNLEQKLFPQYSRWLRIEDGGTLAVQAAASMSVAGH